MAYIGIIKWPCKMDLGLWYFKFGKFMKNIYLYITMANYGSKINFGQKII